MIVLAVYTRSPAAYKALQSFGILKLPSKVTLQAYTVFVVYYKMCTLVTLWLQHDWLLGAFLYGPGPCEENLKKQKIMYEAFQRECQLNKQQAALDTGILVFDELFLS